MFVPLHAKATFDCDIINNSVAVFILLWNNFISGHQQIRKKGNTCMQKSFFFRFDIVFVYQHILIT